MTKRYTFENVYAYVYIYAYVEYFPNLLASWFHTLLMARWTLENRYHTGTVNFSFWYIIVLSGM